MHEKMESQRRVWPFVMIGAALTAVGWIFWRLAVSPVGWFVRPWGLLVIAVSVLAILTLVLGVRRVHARPNGSPFRRALLWLFLAAAVPTPFLVGRSLAVPYQMEEVRFRSGEILLSGTLYVPDREPPHPGVVILHGSEGSRPVTRDGTFGLYRMTADIFARRGVAALIYDKRGSGQSSGNWRTALLTDLADDAVAAVAFLRERRGIDRQRVGIWGISQGGWVGPLAASRSDAVAFVIAVSGPAVSEGEQRLHEFARRLGRRGVPEAHIEELVGLQRLIWEYYRTGDGWEEVRAAWEAAKGEPWWPHCEDIERIGPARPAVVNSPQGDRGLRWHRIDMARDPIEVLRRVRAPTLMLYGGADEVIPVEKSIRRVRELFRARHDPLSKLIVYEGANHAMMVPFPPGFTDGYVDDMTQWLRACLNELGTARPDDP